MGLTRGATGPGCGAGPGARARGPFGTFPGPFGLRGREPGHDAWTRRGRARRGPAGQSPAMRESSSAVASGAASIMSCPYGRSYVSQPAARACS